MMKMTTLILPAALTALSYSGAMAQEAQTSGRAAQRLSGAIALVQARGAASVAAELAQQGYRVTNQRRTLLGRTLLRAENRTHVREVVIHQRTGEILRDVILAERPSDRASGNGGSDSARTSQGGAQVSGGDAAGRGASTSSGGASSSSSASASNGASDNRGGNASGASGSAGGGVSASVGGNGGVSASVGGSGGVSASVGGGGVSVGAGGLGIGN